MGAGRGGNRRGGRYCWVCDRVRANEQFSGKGHRRHICKVCAKLPQAQRNLIQAEKNALKSRHDSVDDDAPPLVQRSNEDWDEIPF